MDCKIFEFDLPSGFDSVCVARVELFGLELRNKENAVIKEGVICSSSLS